MSAPDDPERDEVRHAGARDFERWALVGVAALMAVAVAVVLLRAERQDAADADVRDPGARVTIRLGGGAASDAPAGGVERRPLPVVDPWPPPEPPTDEIRPPPADQPAPVPAAPRAYVVQKGETLSEIARRELGAVNRMHEIVELNGIRNPNAIRAGDTVLLPAR